MQATVEHGTLILEPESLEDAQALSMWWEGHQDLMVNMGKFEAIFEGLGGAIGTMQ